MDWIDLVSRSDLVCSRIVGRGKRIEPSDV